MPSCAILLDPRRSPLLRALYRFLPDIRELIDDPDSWRGWELEDPDSNVAYARLVCRRELVGGRRRLIVALHAFRDTKVAGTLHDHRFPLAVLPLAADGVPGLLYTMPWQRRAEERVVSVGEMSIHHGDAYAVEDCRGVLHAVNSHRPHVSIVLSDVSEPPAREDRLESRPLDSARMDDVRKRCLAALTVRLDAADRP